MISLIKQARSHVSTFKKLYHDFLLTLHILLIFEKLKIEIIYYNKHSK